MGPSLCTEVYLKYVRRLLPKGFLENELSFENGQTLLFFFSKLRYLSLLEIGTYLVLVGFSHFLLCHISFQLLVSKGRCELEPVIMKLNRKLILAGVCMEG